MSDIAESEQVVLAAIIFHPETITRLAKGAMVTSIDGKVRIDATAILFNLFAYPSQFKLLCWLEEGKVIVYTMSDDKLISTERDAAIAISKILVDRGFSAEQTKQLNYYVVKSILLADSPQAYFVIAGKMFEIPSEIITVTL
jgi:hypothetical protein